MKYRTTVEVSLNSGEVKIGHFIGENERNPGKYEVEIGYKIYLIPCDRCRPVS